MLRKVNNNADNIAEDLLYAIIDDYVYGKQIILNMLIRKKKIGFIVLILGFYLFQIVILAQLMLLFK